MVKAVSFHCLVKWAETKNELKEHDTKAKGVTLREVERDLWIVSY